MNLETFLKQLDEYLPSGASELLRDIIEPFGFSLTISRKRVTKHGDYRYPVCNGDTHKISINGTLNANAFLLTLLHEISHMHTYEKYGASIKPHGKEWKHTFTTIAAPFIKNHIWPSDVEEALVEYFKNPKASSGAYPHLVRVLARYDRVRELTLEDIGEGTLFVLPVGGGRLFKKGPKRRTRYLCKEIKTGREYSIHGLAQIIRK